MNKAYDLKEKANEFHILSFQSFFDSKLIILIRLREKKVNIFDLEKTIK